jgi:hypothetical protein
LRQLSDWVERVSSERAGGLSRRERLRNISSALFEAEADVERLASDPAEAATLKAGADFGCPGVTETVFGSVREAVAEAAYAPKGVLVINHECAVTAADRGSPPDSNLERYAEQNHLGILSWIDLLSIASSITESGDALNFFCALFDSSGVLRPPLTYRWEDHCAHYQPILFGEWPGFLSPVTAPPLLRGPRR